MRRYLIVGPAWVGDMVMAQSLFITLRQLHPDCEIDVLAPAWSLPILERMPEVRKGIALPVSHGKLGLMTRWRLGRSLRVEKYTHAIVLPRSWKAALIPWVAAVPVRTGYLGEMRYGLLNDIRKLDKTVLTQTVQRFVALAYDETGKSAPAIPYPGLSTNTVQQSILLQQLGLELSRPVIALMPGAEYGPAKQWPIPYYADLAEKLVGLGYQIWVLGSVKEEPLGEDIVRGCASWGKNLCGKTSLVDVIDLLACAEQVVSNDSGLMHVAAAVNVQVNAIYGSSTPDYTPPLTDKAVIFYKRLSCSPCFSRTCRYGHYNCLSMITADEVVSIVLVCRVDS